MSLLLQLNSFKKLFLTLKMGICVEAASGPTTILNIFFKLLQGNEHTAV
jgi:hypothetical protein